MLIIWRNGNAWYNSDSEASLISPRRGTDPKINRKYTWLSRTMPACHTRQHKEDVQVRSLNFETILSWNFRLHGQYSDLSLGYSSLPSTLEFWASSPSLGGWKFRIHGDFLFVSFYELSPLFLVSNVLFHPPLLLLLLVSFLHFLFFDLASKFLDNSWVTFIA